MHRPFNRSTVRAFKVLGPLSVLIFELLNPLNLERVSAQTPFYQGKTISIIVGTKAGDVYDLYPRLFAEYLPKYIPGSPNIIIQNVAGAASLIAANQVYNVSKPDGLTLGAIFPALYFDQLIKRPEVKFDWSKWNWIGSPVTSNHLLYMRADTPYKTIEDVRTATKAPKCGSTGIASTAYYVPKLWKKRSRQSLISLRDISPVRISISLSSVASFSAGRLLLPRTSPGSRSFPGANGDSSTC